MTGLRLEGGRRRDAMAEYLAREAAAREATATFRAYARLDSLTREERRDKELWRKRAESAERRRLPMPKLGFVDDRGDRGDGPPRRLPRGHFIPVYERSGQQAAGFGTYKQVRALAQLIASREMGRGLLVCIYKLGRNNERTPAGECWRPLASRVGVGAGNLAIDYCRHPCPNVE